MRLFPVVARYAWPSELDLMARIAGLRLHERWGDWERAAFTAASRNCISVWGRSRIRAAGVAAGAVPSSAHGAGLLHRQPPPPPAGAGPPRPRARPCARCSTGCSPTTRCSRAISSTSRAGSGATSTSSSAGGWSPTGGGSSDAVGPGDEIHVLQALSRRVRRWRDAAAGGDPQGAVRLPPAGGGWAAGPPAFLGDPVSAVLADPRDGALYAALNLGHFGCKLHRSDDGGAELARAAGAGLSGRPRGREPAGAGHDLEPRRRRPRRAGRGLVRHAAGRALPAAATAARAGRSSPRSGNGPSGPSGSAAATTIRASTRSSSIRAIRRGSPSGSPAAGSGRATTAARAGGWPARGSATPTCRRSGPTTPNVQDPHLLSACAAAPDAVWCQHHNGMFRSDRRRRDLRRDRAVAALGLRLRGGGASRRPADRLVRAGGQGRVPGAGGRPSAS